VRPRLFLFALLVAAALPLSAPPAAAQSGPAAPQRVGQPGQDARAFSVELSEATFDPAQGNAESSTANADTQASVTPVWGVIGRDDVFADTLAAGALLGGAPLLYVEGGPGGRLDEASAAELVRTLNPGATVYIAGGPDAVSTDVELAVRDLGFINIRLGGQERVETAAVIAREAVRLQGAPSRILLASAANFPDAVAGGALAADGTGPLLLTDPQMLSETTSVFLQEFGQEADVVVLGGEVAIAEPVAVSAQADRRVGGETRAHTAALLAELWPDDRTGAAVIAGFLDDGWRQGQAGATVLQPVLLSGPGPDVLNQPTRDALEGRDGPLFVLGGTDRLSDALAAEVAGAR